MKHREEVLKLRDDVLSIAEDARREFGKLTSDQLNWKPGPERWSVAQCFDHLLTANTAYFPIFQSIVENRKQTRFVERLPGLPKLWARLLINSLDPSNVKKMKAPTSFEPSSSEVSSSIIEDFASQQSQIAETMDKTKDMTLDKIIITSPALSIVTYSALDAYRIMVVHERRHFQQAGRVLNDPNFPKLN